MGYQTIIAYVYEAEVHCVSCAVKRFGVSNPEEVCISEVDVNWIRYNSVDEEGNRIGVDFEGTEVDYHPSCGDCCEPIHNFSIIHYEVTDHCDCSDCQPCNQCWQ